MIISGLILKEAWQWSKLGVTKKNMVLMVSIKKIEDVLHLNGFEIKLYSLNCTVNVYETHH